MSSKTTKRRKKNGFFLGFGGISNFAINEWKIPDIITGEAKKKKQVVYGARAMNAQMPAGFLGRHTEDWDVYTHRPRQTANRMQARLDKQIAGGRDEFYAKPALHKGTYKVMHRGADMRRNTPDDIGIVDYTKMPRTVPTVRVAGVRYESLGSISKGKRKILKDPESAYRHEKDKEDLRRIRVARDFRRF